PVDVVFVRKKSRSGTGFFRVWPFASAHRANVAVQAALVPGGLVLVDDALVGHAINDRHGGLVGGFGVGLVAGLDGLRDFLHLGAHHRAQARIVLAMAFRLPGALLRLLRVSQGLALLGIRISRGSDGFRLAKGCAFSGFSGRMSTTWRVAARRPEHGGCHGEGRQAPVSSAAKENKEYLPGCPAPCSDPRPWSAV